MTETSNASDCNREKTPSSSFRSLHSIPQTSTYPSQRTPPEQNPILDPRTNLDVGTVELPAASEPVEQPFLLQLFAAED